ncbi:uncharacterized protein LOC125492674 [Beta vulgaris subsp. vulgaris]|uniref:uncharacterized protein LOC125492674 n=1 Tax=Beta vulgaris subsp. vulgaris TaxID=3555 RepID=UPI002036DE6C|nr:uncharacterized protein LOC125492674 [Beta vulgaris subsp. vulgaris]
MAVWIHLPELPVEYYDKEALFTIASKLGKPIRVDYATNHLTRARYARICIEINLSKPITSKIWIGNQWQVILYENLHSLCFVCGRIGHQKNQCTESKGKAVMAQHESGSGEETDGSQLYSSQNIDTGVSNAKDDGGTFVSNNQKLQSPTRNPPSPLKVSTKESLGEEFGPWTMVSHRKRFSNFNSQAQKQKSSNKGKLPIPTLAPVSSEARKKTNNLSSSNGVSTNNFWRVLDKGNNASQKDFEGINADYSNIEASNTSPVPIPLPSFPSCSIPSNSHPTQILHMAVEKSNSSVDNISPTLQDIHMQNPSSSTENSPPLSSLSNGKELIFRENSVNLFVEPTKAEECRARQVTRLLGFDDFKAIPPHGLKGGIWLMWKNSVELVSWSEVSPYYFHSLFKFSPNHSEALITGMHAPSTARERHELWKNMEQNLPPDQTPWMVVGDLNEVRTQAEKSGGRAFRNSQCKALNSFMDAACLVDLGFDGNPFTWTNAREGVALIRERLDRALANHTWISEFPGTQVSHLPRSYSDHCPVCVNLNLSSSSNQKMYPFRCKEVWLAHPDFKKFFINNWLNSPVDFLAGRDNFLNNIKSWDCRIFGNLFQKKKRIYARLNGIQIALARCNSSFLSNLEIQLLNDLNEIHLIETRVWAQKAGFDWQRSGDLNTRYFHVLAKIKKSKGKIHALQDSRGVWVYDDSTLKNMARLAFMDILSTKHSSSLLNSSFISPVALASEDALSLGKLVSLEELSHVIKSMSPIKSPGPDEIQPVFYQQYWEDLHEPIVSFVNKCLVEGRIPESINKSYLCLIPKKSAPSTIGDFRPIGLCNTILKILTKTIATRLKTLMPNLTSPLQSSFIKGRSIDENIIILKEVAHLFNRAKRNKSIMALKIDLTKAFDSLEWSFIRDTLVGFNFPKHLVDVIMSVVTSPTIYVLWNGEVTPDFCPSRGIRQGDPLSPYIFVLCMERLSLLIQQKLDIKTWKPLMITRDIGLSHLFYADDVFLFGKASWDNLSLMMEVLNDFGVLSGLFLNKLKSTIIVPKKMDHNVRQSLNSFSGLLVSSNFGKYLGVHISPNKLRKLDYLDLLDKTTDKIRGWQAKLLNMAGRCTLIKSVLNSYPLHVMQTNILPIGILDDLKKKIKRFLWNKVGQRHYISRTSWDHVCRPMMEGGLGIRDLRHWNLCFMAKLGWKFLTQPSKLWVKILNNKYCKGTNFMDVIPNASQSTIWRDILKGRDLLAQGIIMNVGNGEDISLWYHHWVGREPLYKCPDIVIPDSKAHWRVAHIIKNRTWSLDQIAYLLPQEIIKEIKAIPLPTISSVQDELRWVFSSDGDFSIKSAYRKLNPNIHTPSQIPNFWPKLWKIKVPFKYKMLFWNVAHEILPTASNLQKKIQGFDATCQCCVQDLETHLHLFRVVFEGAMARPSSQYNHFFLDYIHNRTVFQNQGKMNTNPQHPIAWKPPVHGYLKLNTDGSWKANDKASGGGVIRRTDGSWFMGFSIKFGAVNPAAAELITIREGLSLAKDHNISRLEVETDAQALKIMLDRAEQLPHHQLSAIICDIVKLLKTNWVVVFLHAKRNANMVAHKLARFGMDMEVDKTTHTSPPQCVMKDYMQELVNPMA